MCSSSKWTTGDIWVQGNSNLVAGNIKKGVNIFGITGSFDVMWEYENALPLIKLITPHNGSLKYFYAKMNYSRGEESGITSEYYIENGVYGSAAGWDEVRGLRFSTASTINLQNYHTLYVWANLLQYDDYRKHYWGVKAVGMGWCTGGSPGTAYGVPSSFPTASTSIAMDALKTIDLPAQEPPSGLTMSDGTTVYGTPVLSIYDISDVETFCYIYGSIAGSSPKCSAARSAALFKIS